MVMCREQLSHMLNMEKQKHQQAQLKEQQEHQARLQVGPHTHTLTNVCLPIQKYTGTAELCMHTKFVFSESCVAFIIIITGACLEGSL